jgi:predicted transcriptional regulator
MYEDLVNEGPIGVTNESQVTAAGYHTIRLTVRQNFVVQNLAMPR